MSFHLQTPPLLIERESHHQTQPVVVPLFFLYLTLFYGHPPIIETLQNQKQENQKLFGFQEFVGSVMDHLMGGPFRENIRKFLKESGDYESYTVSGMPVWSTCLKGRSDAVFYLYVIEETTHSSLAPFCDHCRFAGWGHHYVSKRRYHIIIPGYYDNEKRPLKGNFIGLRSHLLHGLIHCNGYGHLLSLNRLDKKSHSLPGSEIMDCWDMICTNLQTRKISVNDFSRKKSVELRLLHGVAYGTTWFGKWGYKFGSGKFGVTEDKYDWALQFLSTLNLDKIIKDFKNTARSRKIEQIVRGYRKLSETQLLTISDLLHFMLAFKSSNPMKQKNASSRKPHSQKVEKPNSLSTFVSSLGKSECRWPPRRVESVIEAIVKLLNEHKAASGEGKISAMSRQELRDGARNSIGDTGLIDFVLKSISCVTVGDQIISRSMNPLTRVIEFKIHDIIKEGSNTFVSSLASVDSRWPKEKLENAALVIVKILKAYKATMVTGNGAMSRQELRDEARQVIPDTGLIDFVLKSINNQSVGNQIVCRSKNPSTKLIEFAIRDENVGSVAHEAGLDVYGDVVFLYNNVLLGYPKWDSVSLASQTVMDGKQLVKEWESQEEENDQLMTLTCKVLPSFDELETELTRKLCPGEVVRVPPEMTVGELKQVAQCALRDTYHVMREFVVTQIGGLKAMEDEKVLSCAVESGAQVWVRGTGLDMGTKLRYEGGPEDEKVECVCGAKVDDGERMVACDECHVWQHSRCRSIDDDEPPPSYFLCHKCVEQG